MAIYTVYMDRKSEMFVLETHVWDRTSEAFVKKHTYLDGFRPEKNVFFVNKN